MNCDDEYDFKTEKPLLCFFFSLTAAKLKLRRETTFFLLLLSCVTGLRCELELMHKCKANDETQNKCRCSQDNCIHAAHVKWIQEL